MSVNIYPNPTAGYFNLSINNYVSFAVYNLIGNEVVKPKRTNNIDLTELPSGIYVVKIMDKSGNLISR